MNDIPPLLSPEPSVPPVLAPGAAPGRTRELTAGFATFVLLAWFAGQVFGGMLAAMPIGFIAGVEGATRHLKTPLSQQIEAWKPAMLLWGALVGVIVGGAVMVFLSRQQLGSRLRDRSPTGAAWAWGRLRHMGEGLGVGILVGLGCVLINAAFEQLGIRANPGPLTKMLLAPGISQVVLVVVALLLAPPTEELLFRGVLYGGYRRSLGAPAAAGLTTAIFVLLHLQELIGYFPAVFGITGLAVAALWQRLRSAAMGPPVAVHFGYNLVITAGAILATWQK